MTTHTAPRHALPTPLRSNVPDTPEAPHAHRAPEAGPPRFDGCYHGGAFFDAIGPAFDQLHRRHTVISADVLDAPFDPAPGVMRALRAHLPWLLRTSPPTQCEGVVQTIAARRGVPAACVLPGAGSSNLIYLALRHLLSPTSRALVLDPTYGEYVHVLENVIGCHVSRLPLHADSNYDVDPQQLQDALQADLDLVVLVNPNSPTGRFMPRATVEALIDAAPRRTRFWIDETYINYVDGGSGDASLEQFAASRDDTIVCKSMSKGYALSGVRAGYLCGSSALIEPMRRVNPPWAMSLPAQVAAVAALDDPDYYRACYADVARRRDALAKTLRDRFQFDVIPGVANFLLCHLPPHAPTGAELVAACRAHDLFLRDVSSMGRTLGERAVRIAVKDQPTHQRMLSILANVIEPGPSLLRGVHSARGDA